MECKLSFGVPCPHYKQGCEDTHLFCIDQKVLAANEPKIDTSGDGGCASDGCMAVMALRPTYTVLYMYFVAYGIGNDV
jgi:hypothetical protein